VLNTLANDPQLSEKMEKTFELLNCNKDVDQFSISDENAGEIISVPKDDFKPIAIRRERKIKNPNEIIERALLYLRGLVFDLKSKWRFVYNGKKISASISDPIFKEKIMMGEKFAQGDVLDVELKIYRVFDNIANTHLNKTYEVVKVFNHMRREIEGQNALEFNA
jgi:hypothetical protein